MRLIIYSNPCSILLDDIKYFMIIRSATKEDLKTCEYLIHIPEMKLANGEYMQENFLQNYMDDDFFLVAVDDEKNIVGMIYGEELKGKWAIIRMLVVERHCRGKGIGTSLLQSFEQKMKKRWIEWIILYEYLHNAQVLEFYKKRWYTAGTDTKECLKNI
jgi:ribosomal protein S18 acetylase RimI-like enzyme